MKGRETLLRNLTPLGGTRFREGGFRPFTRLVCLRLRSIAL